MRRARAALRADRRRVFAIALTLAALPACGKGSPSIFDAQGPGARSVLRLWWPMLWVSVAVFVFVVAMGTFGIVRGRRRREEDLPREVSWGDRFILVAGLGVTTAVLLAFFVVSLRSMTALARDGERTAMSIHVTAHDWWWEARYSNGAVTANEIHIPAGRRVHLSLESTDVIHSLWVPQLVPKIDLIPGRVNSMWVEADKPGRYRGQCAEYCGLQHAHMILFIVADDARTFGAWMTAAAQPAMPPRGVAARGLAVFLSSTCMGCHAISGTSANAQLGPDLTHLAGRATIAAGTIPLTPAMLAAWITDPQSIKPGVTMPPTSLAAGELQALVAYLMGLR